MRLSSAKARGSTTPPPYQNEVEVRPPLHLNPRTSSLTLNVLTSVLARAL